MNAGLLDGLASTAAGVGVVFALVAARALAMGAARRRLPPPSAGAIGDVGSIGFSGAATLARLDNTPVSRRLGEGCIPAALERAGWRLAPEVFAGVRVIGAGIGLLLGVLTPWPGPVLAPFWCVVGLRAPLFVAGRAAKRRLAAMDAEVPQLLDLLAAASSAGLSASLSLTRATEGIVGPLRGELRQVLRSVDLGGRWRDELRAAAERLGLPDFRRAVAAITRTETLGASLADSTAELAATVRHARRAAVTERARTAPVKMLFPLVFLVLPAFLLLTVVPVLLTTLQSIR